MTYQRVTLILLLAVLLVSSSIGQIRKPIFRSINVSTADKKRSIELGGDLTKNLDIVIKSGDLFVLNGNFGRTERIAIALTATGKVRQIIFDYPASKVFATTVESYSKDLGKPILEDSMDSAILKSRMVAWDDGKTRFEIVEKTENGLTSLSSVMIDKTSN